MTRIALMVDVVLGPALTALIFKSGKPKLRRDLGIIASVQVLALIWAVHILHQERPLFVAFVPHRIGGFFPVTQGMVEERGRSIEELKKLDSQVPARVFVRLPEDPTEQVNLIMGPLFGKAGPLQQPERYEAFSGKNLQAALRFSYDLEALTKQRPEEAAKVQAYLNQHSGKLDDYAFLPLRGRYQSVLLVLTRNDDALMDALYIEPPE